MVNLTPILQAVISLCTALITAFIIPWLRQKAGQERTKRIYALAEIAVRAAEQLYGEGEGKQKAEYVLSYLRQHGFNVSAEELRGTLEAAVYELNHAVDES